MYLFLAFSLVLRYFGKKSVNHSKCTLYKNKLIHTFQANDVFYYEALSRTLIGTPYIRTSLQKYGHIPAVHACVLGMATFFFSTSICKKETSALTPCFTVCSLKQCACIFSDHVGNFHEMQTLQEILKLSRNATVFKQYNSINKFC